MIDQIKNFKCIDSSSVDIVLSDEDNRPIFLI